MAFLALNEVNRLIPPTEKQLKKDRRRIVGMTILQVIVVFSSYMAHDSFAHYMALSSLVVYALSVSAMGLVFKQTLDTRKLYRRYLSEIEADWKRLVGSVEDGPEEMTDGFTTFEAVLESDDEGGVEFATYMQCWDGAKGRWNKEARNSSPLTSYKGPSAFHLSKTPYNEVTAAFASYCLALQATNRAAYVSLKEESVAVENKKAITEGYKADIAIIPTYERIVHGT
jgi:hypothetical protein